MAVLKFAFVVDGDFGIAISVNESHPDYEMLLAIVNSDPKVVMIPESHPDFDNIKFGWTYSNGEWIAPSE